jgi:hypothetical protein
MLLRIDQHLRRSTGVECVPDAPRGTLDRVHRCWRSRDRDRDPSRRIAGVLLLAMILAFLDEHPRRPGDWACSGRIQ